MLNVMLRFKQTEAQKYEGQNLQAKFHNLKGKKRTVLNNQLKLQKLTVVS